MTPLVGPDVSAYQGTVDWSRVAGSAAFGICKATEGHDFTDPLFRRNWPAIRAAGLIRGAYHYAHPGRHSATDEANWFLKVVLGAGYREVGDFLILDFEEADGSITSQQLAAWVREFTGRVAVHTGRKPLIYTGGPFWEQHGVGNDNFGCRLHLAAYVTDPRAYIPPAWRGWTFWQYTSAGNVPGIRGTCDVNRFAGTREQLHEFVGLGKPPTPRHPYPGHPLVEGLRSPSVALVQQKLGVRPASGAFGPRTRLAVEQFQRKHRLHVDGVVGRVTWRALFG